MDPDNLLIEQFEIGDDGNRTRKDATDDTIS